MKVIQGDFSISNQMSLIRDTEEVVKFLEFAGKKLILDSHAVNCRLTACHNLFSVVNEEEDNIDFLIDNLDLLINRLRNKNKSVNESTLKVYKSRLKSTLEDYKSWAADPFAWEKSVTERSKAQAAESRKSERSRKRDSRCTETRKETEKRVVASKVSAPAPLTHQVRKLSLPIRGNVDIEVTLPSEGITVKDLQRIGMFLYPYCNDSDQSVPVFLGLPN